MKAVVVGGGLAGLAAALALGRAGATTTIFERRRVLGGRASSFHDPLEEKLVDNCQHVLLGACTELLDLYRELGVADRLVWRERFRIRTHDGVIGELKPSRWLPSPLAFLPSLLNLPILTRGERWSVARGFLAAFLSRSRRLEDETFAHWLARHGQSRRVIARIWEPFVVSALNESIDRASARAALFVIRGAFFGPRAHARMALPSVPLADLYGTTAQRALAAAGVALRLHADVSDVVIADNRVTGVHSKGEVFPCETVILAVPPEALSRLLPAALFDADARLREAASLESSPIVGAHFFFDRKVSLPDGELALVESTAQWIFDRYAATKRDEDRGHLAVVVSAARSLIDLSKEEIADALLRDLRAVVPGARHRDPRRSLVVKERSATFAPLCGAERRRPGSMTSVAGLFLAGDYCATGWPATMEGAVRSGRAAARAATAGSRAS